MPVSRRDVVIVGAGVIGAACAWRLAQRGRAVTLLDPAPGSGATWTAAGMLAPVTEFGFGENALLGLNLDSARLYPDFVAELESITGMSVGYEQRGTLQVAWDGADLATLRDVHARHEELGLVAELISARELRRLEPALAAGLPGALVAPEDHQINPRSLHQALMAAAGTAGVDLVAQSVVRVEIADCAVRGLTLADGTSMAAEVVVLAAGAHTRRLAGLPAELGSLVRAVKGQTIRLSGLPAQPLISHAVRGSVKGTPIYLVPRAAGEIVVGASSEDAGFDTRPRAGAIYELLRDAFAVVPGLSEWSWDEVSTGLRPGTPDNLPLIGVSTVDGLVVATGHYRNGVLLAPITADAVVAAVLGEVVADSVKACDPRRFARVRL